MNESHVLVTGGSGFIAGHCILQLLDEGHRVRATLRSLAKEQAVREVLTQAGMTRGEALEFVAADLTDDAGWAEAMTGIDALLHVASPVAPGAVADEQSVIVPARDGALRALRAAHAAGVRRAVLTSAFHAIGFGHPHSRTHFTEEDWSPLHGPGMDAYGRSKLLAERAAWEYVEGEGSGIELVTICPVAVMGPVLGREVSGANHLVQQMLTGKVPVLPDLAIPVVDVRDVAAAHVAALRVPEAAGHRFLVGSRGPATPMAEIAAILREALGPDASRVPTRRMPSWLLRLVARVRPEFGEAVPELGLVKVPGIEPMRRVLGVEPRPAHVAIVAAGRSLVARQLV